MKYFFDTCYSRSGKTTAILLGLWLSSTVAVAGTLAQTPLFLATGSKPNIMLMIDRSGSMSNIVQDAPYNPGTTYIASCPSANLVPAGSLVDIALLSSQPRIRYSNTNYVLGTGSGQKCFGTALIYSAHLNLNGSSGNSSVQGGYLDADYTGNYLNWYFNANNTTPAWTSGQQKKPGTQSRMEIAKTSAKGLVSSLSNIRLGLSTYNGDNGGSLREIVDDISAAKITSVNAKIDALTASGQTPLAETLSDIGRYFATGASGNLTLHPGQSNQGTASVDAVFRQGDTNTASSQTSHNLSNNSGQTIVNPIQNSCQKSFAVLLTDGRPSGDRAVSTLLRDYTGDCVTKGLCDASWTSGNLPSTAITGTGSTTTCSNTEKNWKACKNGTKVGRTYEQAGSDYLDDVANALFDMDLRPDLVDPRGIKNNLTTYTIGFADTTVANDPLLGDTATRAGGLFFNAANSADLVTTLQDTVADISSKAQSAAAVAANSSRLDTTTLIYQSKFDAFDWSGELEAFSVNISNGALSHEWFASQNTPAHDARTIYTFNPLAAAGQRGALFQWANLTCPGPASTNCQSANIQTGGISQQDKLNKDNFTNATDNNGALRVNWLRGDHTNEKTSPSDTTTGHIFRKRTNILGDIINSDPVFVGKQDFGYGALPSIGSTYTDFINSAAYQNRRPMIYLGANDGMLHGFDARKNSSVAPVVTDGGKEIFAYIPNALFPELSNLTATNYNEHHQYYVDGPSGMGDVYDPSIPSPAPPWRTLLVGVTGAGGKALFGLDVTNPDAFGSGSPLWEFTNSVPPVATDCSAFGAASRNYDVDDLGFTLTQPSVVRMQDGSWAVIAANGYDSNNGHAVLFILDAKSGCTLQKIDTGAGPSTPVPPGRSDKNGLSTPIAVDTNNDFSVDTVYAGDLYGNLWKFDLSGAHGSWPAPASPLFVACAQAGTSCSTADRQPITAKPNVGQPGAAGTDQNGAGMMVYFGTGKYFENGDNIVGTTPPPQLQTFYGLWDRGTAITDRANLVTQNVIFDDFATTTCVTDATTNPPTTAPCQSTDKVRVVSDNPVCYAASSTGCTTSSPLKSGWALNLTNPNGTLVGERVISFPLVRRGLVVFATAIPDSDPCRSGGDSRLMEVDALKGGPFTGAAFDVNGDGVVDDNDRVSVSIGGTTLLVSASGINLEIGIMKTPAVVEGTPTTSPGSTVAVGVDYKYSSGTKNAQIGKVVDAGGTGTPPGGPGTTSSGTRRAWRQLK